MVFNSNATVMYGGTVWSWRPGLEGPVCSEQLTFLFTSPAMLQADDEDDAMDQQMKSPFGSSFRTFDATDYKPIGRLLSSAQTGFWIQVLMTRLLFSQPRWT